MTIQRSVLEYHTGTGASTALPVPLTHMKLKGKRTGTEGQTALLSDAAYRSGMPVADL